MPPYLFRRKNKARDIGKKAIFECISCAKNDVRNYAHAIKYEGLDGEYHELVHWLLPDKKRDTYDTFFGLLKTALTSQNLELSARN